MKNKKIIIPILFLLVLCLGIYIIGKDPDTSDTNSSTSSDSPASIQKGKALSVKHCQSCHMLPDPSLLDKENWQTVLNMMAPRLGIFFHNNQAYPIFTDIDQTFYPSEAAMSSSEWQNIIDYYLSKAPSALEPPKRKKPIKKELPFFAVTLPSQSFYRKGNTATLIDIDTSVKPHRLFVNSVLNTLFLLNGKLQVIDSLQTKGSVVDIDINGNELAATEIGRDVSGNNLKLGTLIQLQVSKGNIQAAAKPLFSTLARPVQITSADLNGDQKKDYLICEFGNLTGSLSWMENQGQGKYLRHDIRPVPGAAKAYIQDYNHDGLPDIWALFSQGEEGIFLFTNKGNGLFDQKQVVRFPPSYGSNSFELVDFDRDGFLDILYTCGDRGDGINQLKPYHGVYIFMNNRKNVFTEQYFFPINGCINAMARDFDRDGDLDIAAIGLYTDTRQPEEGFIYLDNKGKFDFDPYSLPMETKFKTATTMDVGDLDGDGKLDIVLGHGFMDPKDMNEKRPLFIVLKNRF